MPTNPAQLHARSTWFTLVLPVAPAVGLVRRLVAGVRRLLSETSRSKAEAIHDLSPRMLRDLGLEGTPTRQARRFVDAEAQLGMFR